MDWLLEIEVELSEQAYWTVADLLNLEVDLLFFETNFDIGQADGPEVDEQGQVVRPGFRIHGHSKDHRRDLPGRDRAGGDPRRHSNPGLGLAPQRLRPKELIRQVKEDLRAWKLTRVVWVTDTGFNSAENRRYLQRAGGHYIIGEKLRGDSKEGRPRSPARGRFHKVAGNLEVKEVCRTMAPCATAS